MDFKSKAIVVLRRLSELLIFEFLASAIITLMVETDAITEQKILAVIVSIVFAAFLIMNVKQTRYCYLDLDNKKWHYILNIVAFALFTGINFLAFAFFSTQIYDLTLALTKVFRYISKGISTFNSLVLYHIIAFVAIMAAPFGMDDVIEQVKLEQSQYEEDDE